MECEKCKSKKIVIICSRAGSDRNIYVCQDCKHVYRGGKE